MSTVSLVGKVACITGASRGIGRGIALALAKEGCKLGICSRKEADINRCKKELEDLGADVIACPVDVSKKDDVREWICCEETDDALQRFSFGSFWHDRYLGGIFVKRVIL